jgi:hypothetical protein
MSKYIEGQAVDPLLFSGDDIIIVVEEATGRDTYTTINTLKALLDTLPVVGGTANGVLYLNGSKVATSGSGLTFDGTNLIVGGTLAESLLTVRGSNARILIRDEGTPIRGQFDVDSTNSTVRVGSRSNHPLLFTIQNSEQMRLNATGLGIGTQNPNTKLEIFDTSTGAILTFNSGTNGSARGINWRNQGSANNFGSITADYTSGVFTYNAGLSVYAGQHVFRIGTAGEAMRLDASGNLGLGVTPSAWAASAKALDFAYPSVAMDTAGAAVLGFNAYNSSGTTWNYKTTDEAALFTITNAGAFTWRQAVSGTAGNAISFTQAMTLTAGGNLLIAVTAEAASARAIIGGTVISTTNTLTTFGGDYAGFDRTSSKNMRIFSGTSDATGSSIEFYSGVFGGINERFRIKSAGQVRYIPLAADPGSAENGDVYYNSSTNKLRLYAAGAWTDLN